MSPPKVYKVVFYLSNVMIASNEYLYHRVSLRRRLPPPLHTDSVIPYRFIRRFPQIIMTKSIYVPTIFWVKKSAN